MLKDVLVYGEMRFVTCSRREIDEYVAAQEQRLLTVKNCAEDDRPARYYRTRDGASTFYEILNKPYGRSGFYRDSIVTRKSPYS